LKPQEKLFYGSVRPLLRPLSPPPPTPSLDLGNRGPRNHSSINCYLKKGILEVSNLIPPPLSPLLVVGSFKANSFSWGFPKWGKGAGHLT